jgi:hypothetical protein
MTRQRGKEATHAAHRFFFCHQAPLIRIGHTWSQCCGHAWDPMPVLKPGCKKERSQRNMRQDSGAKHMQHKALSASKQEELHQGRTGGNYDHESKADRHAKKWPLNSNVAQLHFPAPLFD